MFSYVYLFFNLIKLVRIALYFHNSQQVAMDINASKIETGIVLS